MPKGYGGDVTTKTCPQCNGTMNDARRSGIPVSQCDTCHGIFLARVDLADLVEGETEWHARRKGQHTQPLPRITPDMAAPPAQAPGKVSRSYLDTLFG